MDDSEIQQLLNLPSTGMVFKPPSMDEGTFQLDMEDAAPPLVVSTPKDQIVTDIKAFEQLALIVSIYYKGKYGVPMLPIIPDDEDYSLPNFHLDNE